MRKYYFASGFAVRPGLKKKHSSPALGDKASYPAEGKFPFKSMQAFEWNGYIRAFLESREMTAASKHLEMMVKPGSPLSLRGRITDDCVWLNSNINCCS